MPAVAQCVRVLCDVLAAALQDEEANEEWIETLLERAGGLLRLFLEVKYRTYPWRNRGYRDLTSPVTIGSKLED